MPNLLTRVAVDIVAVAAEITIVVANVMMTTNIVNAATITTMKANVTATVITMNTRNR
jgi:hypothetical protein